MTTPSSVDDPTHWRQRAEDARRDADRHDDPYIKRELIDIAAAYEEVARHIEAKLASGPDGGR
jgi:hypothetical protein